jgi:hypothetical protein
MGEHARRHGAENGIHAFEHGVFHVGDARWLTAELEGPGEAGSIAATCPGQFQCDRLTLRKPAITPHDMRRRRILPRQDRRRQSRDVAGEVRMAAILR